MKHNDFSEWSAQREERNPAQDSLRSWTDGEPSDPRDRSPIEDPQWPYLNPTFPRRPYRLAEEGGDIEPPRSPKKAWTERPPRSPKDVPESDSPRSPKAPIRRLSRFSKDDC